MRNYLKMLRLERGETMEDVAKALGITRQYYEMIEKGKRKKSLDIQTINQLARHFGIPMSVLVDYELHRRE